MNTIKVLFWAGTAASLGLLLLHDSDQLFDRSAPMPKPAPKAPSNVKVGDLVGAPFTAISGKAGNATVPFPFTPDTTMLVFRVTDASGMSSVRGALIGYSTSGQSMNSIEVPSPMIYTLPREQIIAWP
jgi:hypothetical protein